MKRKTLILTLVAAGLVVAASAVAMMRYAPQWLPNGVRMGLAADRGAPDYRAIVHRVAPAVVGIAAVGRHTLGQSATPFFNQGSGFIIDSGGVVLTNAHVVQSADAVTVTLMDRREFTAKVLGLDRTTDIAVLKIDALSLPAVLLGDAQALQVGDRVLAIGSPFGLAQSATQGIVSGKGRTLPGDAVVPFIQTDAAVNPGNSGGPLFDANGAVVGINSQIYSQTGNHQGLAFAVPIDLALRVKNQIVATGEASHAFLGVAMQDLSPGLATAFGLSHQDGTLIAMVTPDSPAADAGLRAGDVITAFNGKAIAHFGDLSQRIGDAMPGQSVRLSIWRKHRALDFMVKFGRIRDPARLQGQPLPEAPPGEPGLTLRKLTVRELAITELPSGMLIEQVAGPAARAGLLPGDVLLAINGDTTQTLKDVQAALHGKPERLALLIQRGSDRMFVPVALP